MQHNLRSFDANRWTDGAPITITNRAGFAHSVSGWQTLRSTQAGMVLRNRHRVHPREHYRLPDGTLVTIEQLVIYEPIQALFRHGCVEFSIADIRVGLFLAYRISLSYKQVRDALYRIDHGKLLFRHVGQGVYSWGMGK